jgi:hypothetical protein
MTLQVLPSEFPYMGGKYNFLFYQCNKPVCLLECMRKFNNWLEGEDGIREPANRNHCYMILYFSTFCMKSGPII